MKPLSKKARSILDELIGAFDHSETLIDTIRAATIIPNTAPCSKWSRHNRFLVALKGSGDTRGYRQW